MYRLRTALGRYSPARSATPISSTRTPAPFRSIASIVSASIPAEPRFDRTRFHASHRTSLRWMRSYSAWKRRSGDRLAAPPSRSWSCRTCSLGWLGRVAPTMPSRLPPPSARLPQGPFPPVALFVATIDGTTVPSDSRCAALDFAFGLYEAPCRDDGNADGSLVFRAEPCTRAAPHTPAGSSAHSAGNGAVDVAFVVKCATRLPRCRSDEAAGFT